MKKSFYTIPQAAKYCAIGRGTLWRWVRAGQIKASRTPGGHYRILKEDLESFIFERDMYPLAHNRSSSNRILIVDDDAEIQQLLKELLSIHGYVTEIASDGFEAGLKTMKFKPEVVILDLLLPGLDGFAVCKQMKKNPDTSHIKILAITGFDTPETKERILEEGADDYLAKPFDDKKLLQHIEKLQKSVNQ